MAKSYSGERFKRSILVHILLNKEPSLVAGQSQQLLAGTGIRRNLEKIQELLSHRNSCTKILRRRPKTGIPATSPKPHSCEKFLPITQEKNPQESWQEHFFTPKK